MPPRQLIERVRDHIEVLYPGHDHQALSERALDAIGIGPSGADEGSVADHEPGGSRWDASDAVLITYADSVVDGDRPPLAVLADVAARVGDALPVFHVLPFFPSSSDRGFAVIDHTEVDPEFGDWDDVSRLGDRVELMVDLVCNHVSTLSPWFRQFLAAEAPGSGYILAADDGVDVSMVVRPRPHPLLQVFETATGARQVWCTFGRDQADLDYHNPDVLLEMLSVVDLLLTRGARILRLDAVAYLWKEPDTQCIHLRGTHEVVRLLRSLLDARAPKALIVTETNVPDVENRSYFGSGNEAHLVYNFSLPPLLVHAILTGHAETLGAWLGGLPPAPSGCTYFNFVASHDGVGLRPAEGLLPRSEIDRLVDLTEKRGGLWGSYSTAEELRPYELNIALWDLFSAPAGSAAPDGLVVERFLCAHAIVLQLAGIPAVYVNNLFAEPGDRAAADASGIARDITRSRLSLSTVAARLGDTETSQGRASASLLGMLRARASQSAFHPDADQRVLVAAGPLLAMERIAPDGSQRLVAVTNFSSEPLAFAGAEMGVEPGDVDVLGGGVVAGDGIVELAPYQTAWLTRTPG